ncbi:hypothetical protein MHUMG1_09586 [Metarhizium humberi]|uniref:Glucose-methanol-choline oxidoreductase C-terminal domain-containing protein n=1 Tax=Metarhizium humberi TaxID=2596975 RepID=A0A9P8M2W6_9HYPO|nr:hypothetical protein MHUMG1_09586 [Metarhizium humberi]
MPTNQTQKEEKPLPVKVDVLIVGSGPIGAVFARELVNAQLKKREDLQILMVDVGPHVVKGQLQHLSVPTGDNATKYIKNGQNPDQDANTNLAEAAASRVVGGMGSHWTCCTPRQHANERLPEFKAVYENYDRAEHLFNTTTTAFDHSVRQQLIMYTLEKAFPTRPIKAMPLACRRNESPHNTNYVEWTCPATILDSGVRGHREKLSDPKYSKVPPTRAWEREPITLNDKFEVWPNTQCVKLNLAEDNKTVKVVSASLKHLLTNAVYNVTADKFVICAGAVLTPGILWNSGFTTTFDRLKPAYYVKELGKNLTEQTMAFCQVELWKEHVENVMTQPPVVDDPKKPFDPNNPTRRPVKDTKITNKPKKEDLPKAWGDFWKTTVPKYWSEGENADKRAASWLALMTELKDKVAKHVETFKLDPLPFPADDPDPQCYYSFASSPDKPWHTQIHRDAFGYGQVPADIDQRRVVDLRWFGYTEENGHNYVTFSTKYQDEFGMPQPIFHFTEDTTTRQQDMRTDMVTVANKLGAIITQPFDVTKNMPRGSALHICGTYKAGIGDKADERSVVNQYGQMWKHPNVVLGGCGVIPRANACNPTLTAACFAIHAVKKMVEDLDK